VKLVLNILAAIFLLTGMVWFLQGINILPGSYMTGDIRWSIYGAITALTGIIIVLVNRRRSTNQK
jgi:hypothetical protein